MKTSCCILAFLLVIVAANTLNGLSELELKAYYELKALFNAIRGSGVNNDDKVGLSSSKNLAFLGKFSYSNCADPKTEILAASNITISPDPIKIPGALIASGSVVINSPFGSPVQAKLEVLKSVFGVWVTVPCIDQFGSCTYEDFCTIVANITCPDEFVKIGLTCKCPFTAGSWNVNSAVVNITQSLPFPITGGVRAKLTATFNGSLVTCVQVEFDLA